MSRRYAQRSFLYSTYHQSSSLSGIYPAISAAGDSHAHQENSRRKKGASTYSAGIVKDCWTCTWNFYQALQLVYFVQVVLQIESNGHSVPWEGWTSISILFIERIYNRENSRMSLLLITWDTWINFFINKIRPWAIPGFQQASFTRMSHRRTTERAGCGKCAELSDSSFRWQDETYATQSFCQVS